jgi:hypothetical protein
MRISVSSLLVFWLTCGWLAASGAVFEIAGPNLLPGGDFEDNPIQTYWRWDDNRGNFSVKPVPGRMSKKAVALVNKGYKGKGKFFTKMVQVPAGRNVRVSLWVKCDNHLGGTFVTFEGATGETFAKFDIAGGTYDWRRYEHRTTIPNDSAEYGTPTTIQIWFYIYGSGTLTIDDIECRVIERDEQAEQKWYNQKASEMVSANPSLLKNSSQKTITNGITGYDQLVCDLSTAVSGHPSFGLLATHGSQRINRERPFLISDLVPTVEIHAARNEFEGAQVLVFALEEDVKGVHVSVGDLQGPAKFEADHISVHPIGFIRATRQRQWYEGRDEKFWADPLLPNREFTVLKGTVQPVYVRIFVPDHAKAGTYTGGIRITAGTRTALIPLSLHVYNVKMSRHLTLKTMTVSGKLEQPYIDLSLQQRMGMGDIAAGMNSIRPNMPQLGTSFDFSEMERKLHYAIDRGQNAFILSSTPKLGKLGFPKEYSSEWKQQMSKVIREYGSWLKEKGLLGMTYFNNIDEPGESEYQDVKELFAMAKAANPEVKVFSCLNMIGSLNELQDHMDVADLYIQQSDQQQAAVWQARGKEIWWALCMWPAERPNLFSDYPLIDARIVGWLCQRYNIDGFEYWNLTAWPAHVQKDESWARCTDGILLTDWVFRRPQSPGDGCLLYPGENGQPINSLRLEALRDGLEDSEILMQLKRLAPGLRSPTKEAAERLLNGNELITSMFQYTQEPISLINARVAALKIIEKNSD